MNLLISLIFWGLLLDHSVNAINPVHKYLPTKAEDEGIHNPEKYVSLAHAVEQLRLMKSSHDKKFPESKTPQNEPTNEQEVSVAPIGKQISLPEEVPIYEDYPNSLEESNPMEDKTINESGNEDYFTERTLKDSSIDKSPKLKSVNSPVEQEPDIKNLKIDVKKTKSGAPPAEHKNALNKHEIKLKYTNNVKHSKPGLKPLSQVPPKIIPQHEANVLNENVIDLELTEAPSVHINEAIIGESKMASPGEEAPEVQSEIPLTFPLNEQNKPVSKPVPKPSQHPKPQQHLRPQPHPVPQQHPKSKPQPQPQSQSQDQDQDQSQPHAQPQPQPQPHAQKTDKQKQKITKSNESSSSKSNVQVPLQTVNIKDAEENKSTRIESNQDESEEIGSHEQQDQMQPKVEPETKVEIKKVEAIKKTHKDIKKPHNRPHRPTIKKQNEKHLPPVPVEKQPVESLVTVASKVTNAFETLSATKQNENKAVLSENENVEKQSQIENEEAKQPVIVAATPKKDSKDVVNYLKQESHQSQSKKARTSNYIIAVTMTLIISAILFTIVGVYYKQISVERRKYVGHLLLGAEDEEEDDMALFNQQTYHDDNNRGYESWKSIH